MYVVARMNPFVRDMHWNSKGRAEAEAYCTDQKLVFVPVSVALGRVFMRMTRAEPLQREYR